MGLWLVASLPLCAFAACTPGTPVTDSDAGPIPDTCPTPTGAGTKHSSPSASETWTQAGSPHIVTSSLTIPEGVTVTLEPCAVVQLGDAVSVTVDGALVSKGTAGKRVRITALDAAKPWTWIDATRTTIQPPIDLAYTVVEKGGLAQDSNAENWAMIRVRAKPDQRPQPMIKVDHVELRDSATIGVRLADEAAFADGSTALTITGSDLEPIHTHALASVPDGAYTGNGHDRIELSTSTPIGVDGQDVDVTLRDRGVPYYVGHAGETAPMWLGPSGSGSTSLTIEPGVVLQFRKGFGLAVYPGASALIAKGTAAKPITFTSGEATKAPGDWTGLYFKSDPAPATSLDHVVIEYAGNSDTAASGYSCGTPPAPATERGKMQGALVFALDGPVTTKILTNSTITDSSNGVDRGWSGDDLDYMATNTFQRITYCAQTLPRGPVPTRTCPMNPPCPPGN